MINDLKVTLYDIFGYLLPGCIFMAGVLLLIWALIYPSQPLPLLHLPVTAWIGLGLATYVLGHVTQGLGNALSRLTPPVEEEMVSCAQHGLPAPILNALQTQLSQRLNIDSHKLSGAWLYRLCDEGHLQSGCGSMREVYVYREGFYRGVTVAFALLALALLFRMLLPGAMLRISGVTYPINRATIGFGLTLAIGSMVVCFFRFRRFARYRVTHALLGYLTFHAERTQASFKD